MKLLNVILFIAGVSLVLAVISRVTITPIPLAKTPVEAEALLSFANACFSLSIVIILLEILKSKK